MNQTAKASFYGVKRKAAVQDEAESNSSILSLCFTLYEFKDLAWSLTRFIVENRHADFSSKAKAKARNINLQYLIFRVC